MVIAWCLEEPWRVGEVAAVTAPSLLGRGPTQLDDSLPRLTFYRQRPGSLIPTPALVGQRLSRAQLEIHPTDAQGSTGLQGPMALRVRSVGRCPLLFQGSETQECLVAPGESLLLRNSMLLLCVQRPRQLPPPRLPLDATFAFGETDAHGMVGESEAIWNLRENLALAAQSSAHVLVLGPSGVGKELAAHALHALSPRAAKEFMARNAATFPATLLDAELFGNAKNYPNPGMPERAGLIGEADGSTLFLDEIGELSSELQAHLLRVLDRSGEYQRLGEPKPRRADLRLVAATNRAEATLKHDFAARFTLRLELPGLDARREDIPLLVRHMLRRFLRDSPQVVYGFFDHSASTPEPRVGPELMLALLQHSYRLNLRELERLVWLSATTSRGSYLQLSPAVAKALAGDAPEPARSSAEEEPAEERTLSEAELRAALQKAEGNVSKAARILKLKNRYLLYRYMKRFGIESAAHADDDDGGTPL